MGTFTNFIEDLGIVEVVYSDKITEEELISDREFGARIIAEQSVKKFLVDARLTTSKPSVEATYAHGVALAGLTKLTDVRLAIVISGIDSKDSLLETVAMNRGGIVQCFELRDDALAWLKNS